MDNRRKRKEDDAAKDKVRQRMHGCLDPDNYQYYPVTIKNADFYDVDVEQNVGIYVRVSTNDISRQHHMNSRKSTTRILSENTRTGIWSKYMRMKG